MHKLGTLTTSRAVEGGERDSAACYTHARSSGCCCHGGHWMLVSIIRAITGVWQSPLHLPSDMRRLQ